jgi:hypothetical protein
LVKIDDAVDPASGGPLPNGTLQMLVQERPADAPRHGRGEPESGDRRRGADGWIFPIVLLVAAALAWLRLGPIVNGTIWAEDGTVFLSAADESRFLSILLDPYAGYLHVVPRLIADVTLLFPAETFASVISILCCLIVGMIAGVVFVFSRSVLPWLPARLFAAAITVLVPVAAAEALGNAANVHTYFLWLAPWLLLARPRSWWASVGLGVLMLLGALTEIQLVFFVPLIFWRLGDPRGWPVRIGMLLGVGAQLATTILWPRVPIENRPPGWLSVVEGYLANAVGSIVQPDGPTLGAFVFDYGWLVLVGIYCVFLAFGLYTIIRGPLLARVATVTFLVGSALSFVAGYVLNPVPAFYYSEFLDADFARLGLVRYAVPSSMFLLAVIPVALQTMRTRGWRIAPLSIGIVIVALSAFHFSSVPNLRSDGPLWVDTVADARELCEGLPGDAKIEVRTAPFLAWGVSLRCTTYER